MAMLLVVSGSTAALLLYGRSNIEQTTIEGISEVRGRTVTLSDGGSIDIINVLMVGTDSPGDLTAEQRARVAPDERSGRRPDTLMLAQLEVGGTGGAVMSLPRDLRVELCDGSTNKINAAFAVAPRANVEPESCLVQTVTALTGIEIDHYVEVDFSGFLRVIEALGGVTMYLEEPMIDQKAHLTVEAGCVTLTPEQALGFVRSRGYDDDFGRMARQQRFLREVLEEARRVGVLANPARVFALVDRASRAVRTDDGLGLSEMRDLALGLRNLTSSSVLSYIVPSEPAMLNGVSYVIADESEAEVLYTSFRDGSVLAPVASGEPVAPPTTEPTVAAEFDPEDVAPIVVLNASGVSGLAGRTAEMLEANGFRITSTGNADAQETTEVVHGTGLEGQGRAVAGVLGEVPVRHEGGGAPLTLLLGADLDRAMIDDLLEEAQARQAVAEAGETAVAGGDGGDTTAGDEPTDGETAAAADQAVDGDTSGTDEPTAEATGDGSTGGAAEAGPVQTEHPSFRGAGRPEDIDC